MMISPLWQAHLLRVQSSSSLTIDLQRTACDADNLPPPLRARAEREITQRSPRRPRTRHRANNADLRRTVRRRWEKAPVAAVRPAWARSPASPRTR